MKQCWLKTCDYHLNAIKICDSHLTWKAANKYLNVSGQVEVVECNKRWFPPFSCCPVSRQYPWKKTLIEKNSDVSRTQEGVTCSYTFWLFFFCATFHHCVTDFRVEGGPFCLSPHLWVALKKPILNRVSNYNYILDFFIINFPGTRILLPSLQGSKYVDTRDIHGWMNQNGNNYTTYQ